VWARSFFAGLKFYPSRGTICADTKAHQNKSLTQPGSASSAGGRDIFICERPEFEVRRRASEGPIGQFIILLNPPCAKPLKDSEEGRKFTFRFERKFKLKSDSIPADRGKRPDNCQHRRARPEL
jgi:hypothetical protein